MKIQSAAGGKVLRVTLATVVVAGVSSCESMGSGSVSGSVGVSMYYGAGYYDPWHYGPGYGPRQ